MNEEKQKKPMRATTICQNDNCHNVIEIPNYEYGQGGLDKMDMCCSDECRNAVIEETISRQERKRHDRY